MKQPAVAFDLDDTLYMESDYVRECLRNVASHTADPEKAFAAMYGQADPFGALTAAMPGSGLTLDRFLHIYRSTAPASLPLRPDALALLSRLSDAGVPLFLITDGRPAGQRNKFAALGLDRFFKPSNIIISGETGFDKHSVVPFALARLRLAEPHRMMYIGDNPAKDFHWPNLLGWDTAMLLHPAGATVHPQTVPDRPGFAPRHIISDLEQAAAIIGL